MENTNFEETVEKITRLILTSPQKMIREDDLRNLSKDFNFDEIIGNVYLNLKRAGFEFITSKFLDQKYYVLTIDGKDDNITPSQYGTLALIVALAKEVDENIKVSDMKKIFSEVWSSDVQFLIQNEYLREVKDLGLIKVTPLGKAVLKNVIEDLRLKNLLDIFKDK
ncbi:MAG: hypothetical protein ACFE85_02460 [Candidatus Hodarchaeota archaeon]